MELSGRVLRAATGMYLSRKKMNQLTLLQKSDQKNPSPRKANLPSRPTEKKYYIHWQPRNANEKSMFNNIVNIILIVE